MPPLASNAPDTRAAGVERPLAAVRLVTCREEYADEGPDVVISRELAAAVETGSRARSRSPSLESAGYAPPSLPASGDTFECRDCSISLTVHTARSGWRARCHYATTL